MKTATFNIDGIVNLCDVTEIRQNNLYMLCKSVLNTSISLMELKRCAKHLSMQIQ